MKSTSFVVSTAAVVVLGLAQIASATEFKNPILTVTAEYPGGKYSCKIFPDEVQTVKYAEGQDPVVGKPTPIVLDDTGFKTIAEVKAAIDKAAAGEVATREDSLNVGPTLMEITATQITDTDTVKKTFTVVKIDRSTGTTQVSINQAEEAAALGGVVTANCQ